MFVSKVTCLCSDCRHAVIVISTVIIITIIVVVERVRCACTHVFVCAFCQCWSCAPLPAHASFSIYRVCRSIKINISSSAPRLLCLRSGQLNVTPMRLGHVLERHRGMTKLDCGAISIACDACPHSDALKWWGGVMGTPAFKPSEIRQKPSRKDKNKISKFACSHTVVNENTAENSL